MEGFWDLGVVEGEPDLFPGFAAGYLVFFWEGETKVTHGLVLTCFYKKGEEKGRPTRRLI